MTTPDELDELAGFRKVQWTKETPISEQIRINLGDDKATIKLNLENPRLGSGCTRSRNATKTVSAQSRLNSPTHFGQQAHQPSAKSHIWRLDI